MFLESNYLEKKDYTKVEVNNNPLNSLDVALIIISCADKSFLQHKKSPEVTLNLIKTLTYLAQGFYISMNEKILFEDDLLLINNQITTNRLDEVFGKENKIIKDLFPLNANILKKTSCASTWQPKDNIFLQNMTFAFAYKGEESLNNILINTKPFRNARCSKENFVSKKDMKEFFDILQKRRLKLNESTEFKEIEVKKGVKDE